MIQSYAYLLTKGDVVFVTSGDLSGGLYTISPDVNDLYFVVQASCGIKFPPCVAGKQFVVIKDGMISIYFTPDDDGTEVIRGRAGGAAISNTTEFEMDANPTNQWAFIKCVSATEWIVNSD